MDVVLKRAGDKVGLYINSMLATTFGNKSIEQVVDWTKNNLKGVKIHIVS